MVIWYSICKKSVYVKNLQTLCKYVTIGQIEEKISYINVCMFIGLAIYYRKIGRLKKNKKWKKM